VNGEKRGPSWDYPRKSKVLPEQQQGRSEKEKGEIIDWKKYSYCKEGEPSYGEKKMAYKLGVKK